MLKKAIAFLVSVLIVSAVCLPALAHTTLQVNLFDGNGSSAVGTELIG